MGAKFEIDPAALRAAAGDLRLSSSEIEGHGETLGAATEAPVGEGTLGQVVEDTVKRGIKIVEKGITDAVKTFHEATASGLEKVAEETERIDGEAKTAFDDLERSGTIVGNENPGAVTTSPQSLSSDPGHASIPPHQDPALASHQGNATQQEFDQQFPELTNINPFSNSGLWGYQENCQSCVVATDQALAAGGHVTQAAQRDIFHPNAPPFDWPTNVTGTIGGGNSFQPVGGYDDIMNELLTAGDGSRGVIHGGRLNSQGVYTSGHVFNVVNRGGKIYFVDGQVGGWALLENFGLLEFLRTN
jgi:hypothetical protein